MKIFDALSALLKASADKLELKNHQEQLTLQCYSCNLPFFCMQYVVLPVFSAFWVRQFIAEELFCKCENCLFRVALPQVLSEKDLILLQRKLERKTAKIMGRSFADVVQSHLVSMTSEYVIFRM